MSSSSSSSATQSSSSSAAASPLITSSGPCPSNGAIAPLDPAAQQRFYRSKATLRKQGEKLHKRFHTENFFLVVRPAAAELAKEGENSCKGKRCPRGNVWVHCTPGGVAERFWGDPRAKALFHEHMAAAGHGSLLGKLVRKKLKAVTERSGAALHHGHGQGQGEGPDDESDEGMHAARSSALFQDAFSSATRETHGHMTQQMDAALRERQAAAEKESESEGQRWKAVERRRKAIGKASGKRAAKASFFDGDEGNECALEPFAKKAKKGDGGKGPQVPAQKSRGVRRVVAGGKKFDRSAMQKGKKRGQYKKRVAKKKM